MTDGTLRRLAGGAGVPLAVQEMDNAEGALLSAAARFPGLGGMVFKGGTALKKIHFRDYRFSRGLDFECLEDVSNAFISFMEGNIGGLDVDFVKIDGVDRGGDGVHFRAVYRQATDSVARIRVNLGLRGDVALAHPYMPILDAYGGTAGRPRLPTMAVEEIMAEKIVVLACTPHPRHLYDIMELHRRGVRADPALVRAKTRSRRGDVPGPGRIREVVHEAGRGWTDDLAPLVPSGPPPFEEAAGAVRLLDAMG